MTWRRWCGGERGRGGGRGGGGERGRRRRVGGKMDARCSPPLSSSLLPTSSLSPTPLPLSYMTTELIYIRRREGGWQEGREGGRGRGGLKPVFSSKQWTWSWECVCVRVCVCVCSMEDMSHPCGPASQGR